MKTIPPIPESDTWRTPKHVVTLAERFFFDGIDLDPAPGFVPSCLGGTVSWIPAKRTFDPFSGYNGLEQDWRPYKNVWLNPPYSHPLPWVTKGLEEAQEILMLVRSGTGAKWFHKILEWDRSIGICVIKGRLHFNDLPKRSPNFDSLLIYAGDHGDFFKEVFCRPDEKGFQLGTYLGRG